MTVTPERFLMKRCPKPDDRLHHETFGTGRVLRVTGLGTGNERVTVAFEEHGEKELLWGFCAGKVRKLRNPHGRHIDGRGRK